MIFPVSLFLEDFLLSENYESGFIRRKAKNNRNNCCYFVRFCSKIDKYNM